jgi:anti-sigma factor RsiW
MMSHVMTDHVTDEQIDDFRRGRLADPDRRSVANHLAECPRCSGRAAADPSIAAAAKGLGDDLRAFEHPDIDELFAYVNGEVTDARAAAIAEHLRHCTRCAEDVADASREREQLQPKPQRAWLAAAAVIVAAILGGAWWLARYASRPPQRPPSIAQRSSPVADEARRNGAIAMPPVLLDLRGTREALRGSSTASTAAPTDLDMRPAGIVVATDRPEFSWHAPAGRRFVVTVMCSEAIAAVSGPVSDGRWTPQQPLPRGAKCVWQLDRLPEHTIVPQPPDPQPAFRILDAASLASIAGADGDDFTSGVLYARAGAQQEALEHFQRWLHAHPNDAAARSVMESVRRW